MKKKSIIYIVLIIIFAVGLNIFLPRLNRGIVYKATELPSEFCTEKNPRVVENTDKKGCLTFGPYREQEKGKIQVTVYYKTDVDKNWVDVYSDKLQETFSRVDLSSKEKKVAFETEISTDLNDLEVRTHYEGTGYLEIEKIVITERVDELRYFIDIYNVITFCMIMGIIYFKKQN